MTMQRLAASVLAAVVLALAAGCSAIDAGAVTKKDYRAPYEWIEMRCTVFHKDGTCQVQMPIVHEEPARWTLSLDDGTDTGWVSVSEPEYERCDVGEQYPACAAAGPR